MADDELYSKLNTLRDEYRTKMNRCAEAAQKAAATEDMDECSRQSTESERNREAFHALNRAIAIVDSHFPH